MADLLFSTTMRTATATNKSGFDRDGSNRLGHMTVARIPAGILNDTTSTTSRIVRLFLDTSGNQRRADDQGQPEAGLPGHLAARR